MRRGPRTPIVRFAARVNRQRIDNPSAYRERNETQMQRTKKALFALLFVPLAGFGQKNAPSAVPVQADIQTVNVRTLDDGNVLRRAIDMKFFRRADGSTRLDDGRRIVIVNKAAHQIIVMDQALKTANVHTEPQPTALVMRSKASEFGVASSTALGTKQIAGYTVQGTQKTSVIPANSEFGNQNPITKTTQVWRSPDLNLPLLTVITDPLSGTTTTQYQSLQKNPALDDSLFAIPPGYTITSGNQSRIISKQVD